MTDIIKFNLWTPPPETPKPKKELPFKPIYLIIPVAAVMALFGGLYLLAPKIKEESKKPEKEEVAKADTTTRVPAAPVETTTIPVETTAQVTPTPVATKPPEASSSPIKTLYERRAALLGYLQVLDSIPLPFNRLCFNIEAPALYIEGSTTDTTGGYLKGLPFSPLVEKRRRTGTEFVLISKRIAPLYEVPSTVVLQDGVVPEYLIDNFTQSIIEEAKRLGVDLLSFPKYKEEKTPLGKKLSFVIRGTGKPNAIIQFIRELNRSEKLIEVEGFGIEKVVGGFSFTISLAVYSV
ncbi:hypothetical protein J7K18_06290 [bacterium]|nr:hypothetical protein [bacterium]